MKPTLRICVLLLCAASTFAGAEEGPPRKLTLREASDMALKFHPRISAAELRALAAKEMTREVRSGFLPSLSANVTSVGAARDNTRIAAGGLNNPSIFDRNAEGINVTHLITDFGR